MWSGGARYLVTMTSGGYEMVVDLEEKKCACRKWEMSGIIPCYHVCACIAWRKMAYEDFIHPCYIKEVFLECYKHIVEPIYGEEEWKKTSYSKPLPPAVKPQTGRPKKKRNKASDVISTDPTRLKRQNKNVKYSYCCEYSHNIRTCPAKASDRANGCEKQVKTRARKNSAKTAASASAGIVSSGAVENPRPQKKAAERNPKAKAITATKSNEGIQGGSSITNHLKQRC